MESDIYWLGYTVQGSLDLSSTEDSVRVVVVVVEGDVDVDDAYVSRELGIWF